MIQDPDLYIGGGKFEIYHKAYYRASKVCDRLRELSTLIAMYRRDKKRKHGLAMIPLRYDETDYLDLGQLHNKLQKKMTDIDLTCNVPETVFQICCDTDLLCEKAEQLINRINIINYMPPKIKGDTLEFILC